MKKILTALNNPKLNEELKKEKQINVIGKDVQYKEGILEILEKEKNIDFIFINEKLEGEINLFYLIKKIKQINKKIKIIIILKKENEELKKKLNKINIFDIYLYNKLNNKKILEIIFQKNIKKEINKNNLNKIKNKYQIINNKKIENKINKNKIEKFLILKNNKKIFSIDNLNLYKIIFKLKYKIILKSEKIKNNNLGKVIMITGEDGVKKSRLSLIIGYYVSRKNKKTVLIDMYLQKQNLLKSLEKIKDKNIDFYKKEGVFFQINNNLRVYQNSKIKQQKYFEDIIQKLKKENEYIIVDCPINYNFNLKIFDSIILILKPEIKNLKEIYFKYQKIFFKEKNKLNILLNKKIFNFISPKIISKIFDKKIIN